MVFSNKEKELLSILIKDYRTLVTEGLIYEEDDSLDQVEDLVKRLPYSVRAFLDGVAEEVDSKGKK